MKTVKSIMKMKNLGFEYDKKFFCGHIISSKIRDVLENEVKDALKLYKDKNKCEHNIVQDESGWLYDVRVCVICGKGK